MKRFPFLFPSSRRARGLLLALGFGLAAAPALAHDKWLEVEPPVAETPQPAKVYLATGEALREAQLLPERRRSRLVRFELRSARGTADLIPRFHEDQQPIAMLPPLVLGSHMVRLDTTPVEIELEASKFGAYLLDERLIDILAERQRRGEEDAAGRERYSRHLKAIVQVGDRLDPLVTQPLGQELELVPVVSPHGLGAGAELPVRVLFHGQPLSGCAVSAAHKWHGRVSEVYRRTDSTGLARFPIEPRGLWLVRLVHMQRAQGVDAAGGIDWRSHWSSLSFAFREPQAP